MQQIFEVPPRWIPESPTVAAFVEVWGTRPLGRFLINSAIIGLVVTVLSVTLAFFAGYGLSRFRFRGASHLAQFILLTQMLPEVMLVVPYFVIMAKLGLTNTYAALIMAYTSFALPFATWMLKGYMDSIPKELDEAALIDGCSRLAALTRIVGPVAAPGIAVTSVFSLILSWNHYLFALALTNREEMFTFSVGLASFMGEYRTTWNFVMAASLIGAAPLLFATALAERSLVRGLSAGAVRG
ncbi:carbohydrate ABC transporter permease [Geochorda subterranea]|uniref:Carbohydrate ABC transporter permease n=1 Tax=Geochorda subterranea TaxID=3109564 RepID=A0ABZ1BMR5_9FIRM|nr:carbohydrate ABC transporter permease [Limnochorda sp. LNt]WRP13741.1 carbohydrate ABC transporter permease [Limnochorda sp. LNt]